MPPRDIYAARIGVITVFVWYGMRFSPQFGTELNISGLYIADLSI